MYMDEMNREGQPPRIPRMGMAVASLVLGALAVFMSFLLIGILLGLIGVVLGGIHLGSERQHRAMAGGGIFLSLVGIVMGVGFGVLYSVLFQEVMPAFDYDFDGNEHLAQWEGVRAPDAELEDLDGATYTLSELRGKRVVLFWFSNWSGDEPVEHVVQLADEESAGDLVVIGISDDDLDELRAYMNDMKINFPVVAQAELPSPYGDVFDMPTTTIIDRNGVIQTIASNYEDYEDYDALKSAALAEDFAGTPVESLPTPREGLLDAPVTLVASKLWSVDVEEGGALETGDWDGDGNDEILVTTWGESLEVLRPDGTPLTTINLPESVSHVVLVAHQDGPRLFGFSSYVEGVYVMDLAGTVLWEYTGGWLPSMVQDVHWGDVDGDGNDEFAISMFNGLHLVSEDGERIWRNRSASGSVAVVGAGSDNARIYSAQFTSVKVFDSAGDERDSFGLTGLFARGMHGVQIAPDGPVQLLFSGDAAVFAASPSGEIAWKASRIDDEDAYAEIFCNFGDVNGDGRREWLFQEGNGDLAAVTPEGERLGVVSGLDELVSFGVARRAGMGGALITLSDGAVTAYAMEPESPESSDASEAGDAGVVSGENAADAVVETTESAPIDSVAGASADAAESALVNEGAEQ